ECVGMIATAELRLFADSCRKMAVATNNPIWLELADRWMRCIGVAAGRGMAAKPGNPADPNGGEAKKGSHLAAGELVAWSGRRPEGGMFSPRRDYQTSAP